MNSSSTLTGFPFKLSSGGIFGKIFVLFFEGRFTGNLGSGERIWILSLSVAADDDCDDDDGGGGGVVGGGGSDVGDGGGGG